MTDVTNHNPTPRAERIGKYQIVGHIASGGMGEVYKARDVDLDRLVALKILPRGMAKQLTTLERFRREAKAAALLRHENIVTIYDVGESDGTHFIAFEFIEGTDLQDYINRKCRIDPEEARQIMIQAVRALAHAHEHKLVHRDIKPSNFLLLQKDKRLIVKLTDFGLAMRHENDAEFRLTRDKTTVGTVDYMSPEQARDSRSADIRSDIYSLGCTAYHMLAGNAPFARGTLPERIVQHMQAPPTDVRKLNKSVPAYLVTIINRMLAKKPDDRYQSPAELLADLEHPEKVPPSGKLVPGTGKLGRDKARKQKSDPTAVVESEEIDEEVEKPAPVKSSLAKKPEPVRTEHADNWVESATQETEAKPRRAKKSTPGVSPIMIYGTGGTVAILVLIIVVVLAFGGRPAPVVEKPVPKPLEPPPLVLPEVKPEVPPVIDTAPSKMTVAARRLPIMDLPPEKADREALRKLHYGPFTSFPEFPPETPVMRVSRLAEPGPTAFRTLEAALAQTKPGQFTVIEIDDAGPFFISALPPLEQTSLLIRGGAGVRPLLVWDMPLKGIESKAPPRFASLTRGTLVLEDLDFVMHSSADMPAVMFNLPETDLYARNCTFSLGGKTQAGAVLIRRTVNPSNDAKTKTWLHRCYVRGGTATLLDLHGGGEEVLVEDSLVVGHQAPLFAIRGRAKDEVELRCVRSTLVAGQTMLRWQTLADRGATPAVNAWLLDSIVSRDDAAAAAGDMVELADGADASRMRWQASNSVYAGWKRLLSTESRTVAGYDLDTWRKRWRYKDGDRAVVDSWPRNPPSGLEEQPAMTFLPGQADVAFASLTGPGAIGCTIGWLPTAPVNWIERTMDPRPVAPIPAADDAVPALANVADGFYHGERLDATKGDFGNYLTGVLQTRKPAPRVVIHVSGRGVCQSSPVRVKGVQNLILYFEPSKNAKEPFTLEFSMPDPARPTAAIEISGGGGVEVIGLRARLNAFAPPPALIQVHGGSLTVTRCWLQGPLTKAPDEFQCVIGMDNTDARPATLLLRDNVLLANNKLVHLQDHVQLRARNNVGVTLGDAIVFEANQPTPPLVHLFDHNTLAARYNILTLRSGPDFTAAGTVLLHAGSNAFLAPFADSADSRSLLRADEAVLSGGRWTWQGRYNVYDVRLHAFLGGNGKPIAKQTLRDWQVIWGQAGEMDSASFDPGAAVKAIVADGPGPATWVTQLDRLILPLTFRGAPGQAPPGANLVELGVAKKKG